MRTLTKTTRSRKNVLRYLTWNKMLLVVDYYTDNDHRGMVYEMRLIDADAREAFGYLGFDKTKSILVDKLLLAWVKELIKDKMLEAVSSPPRASHVIYCHRECLMQDESHAPAYYNTTTGGL